MMMDLRDLYQDVILDHSKHPRNAGRLDPHTHDANGNNPLCGDKISVTLNVEDGIVVDVAFDAKGCAITVASASMMTEIIKGKTVEEAQAFFADFQELLTRKEPIGEGELADLDGLAALTGVREFPMRVKCATLPWHTVNAALAGGEDDVTTET